MPGLCKTGATFKAEETEILDHPKVTLYNVSLNSQKGHIFLRLSQVWEETEVYTMNFPEENQSLEYAKLNPNMTVPVLQIDDVVITDSLEIGRYLRENYPGDGDLNAPRAEVDAFIGLLQEFDEGLFTYRRMGSMGSMANKLRLLRLHEALAEAIEQEEEDELLRDGRTIRETYVQKIAQIKLIDEAGAGEMTPELERNIALNDEVVKKIFAETDRLVATNDHRGLFCDDYCLADGFLACVVFRIGDTDAALLKELLEENPNAKIWWDTFCQSGESEVILPFDMKWAQRTALYNGAPRKMIGLKTGCLKPPALPEEVEDEVDKELEKQRTAYYAK